MTGAPRDLLAHAQDLLGRADPATAGLWPRASALLARRALERGMGQLWDDRAVSLQAWPIRAQLICLRRYLGDADLAARAAHTWSELSRACRHHPYELAPTAAELRVWFGAVDELLRKVAPPSAG